MEWCQQCCLTLDIIGPVDCNFLCDQRRGDVEANQAAHRQVCLQIDWVRCGMVGLLLGAC